MALILVLGGTGTFGRLAVGDLLVRSQHDVAAASRHGIPSDHWPPGSEGRLTSHQVDGSKVSDLVSLIEHLQPQVIVHAAGPYFAIGTAPLQAALATGTAYIDLCPRAFRYRELENQFGGKAIDAEIPVLVGASTVGGITGLLTRRATAKMESVDRVQSVLSVHNFGWGGGLVSDYLRTASQATKQGLPGAIRKQVSFPDGTNRSVAIGDTLEHIPTAGLCEDTTHWFGLNSRSANTSMRLGERFARIGLPVWHAAGIGGWLAGRIGGHRTNGILVHEAEGKMDGQQGLLRTTVIRPFGNVRNPAVLAAITASELASGADMGTGFIHPASWMDPERIVFELKNRANVVQTMFYPQATFDHQIV